VSSSAENPELPVIVKGAPCRKLRSKGMYVYTDVIINDDTDDDENDCTDYWCLETMRGVGPDDALVNRSECRNTARGCYEPT
jgi:hypothetical protein